MINAIAMFVARCGEISWLFDYSSNCIVVGKGLIDVVLATRFITSNGIIIRCTLIVLFVFEVILNYCCTHSQRNVCESSFKTSTSFH